MTSARGRVELLEVSVWHFVPAAMAISFAYTRDICVTPQLFLCAVDAHFQVVARSIRWNRSL